MPFPQSPYFYLFLHVLGFSLWSSFWPREFVKKRLEPKLGYRAYRLLYNAGTIFLFGASILYLFQRSGETVQLWYLRDRVWFKPLLYSIGTAGIFFLYGVSQLGASFWGFKKPPAASDAQVRGYYKITRHPLYVSVFCFLLGHTLVLGSGLAVFYFFAMELYNVLGVIFLEDPNLIRRYGESYRDYQKTVSVIPFLSILQGKIKLTRSDLPPRVFVGVALCTAFVILIHRPVIVFLVYYLPPLGHVTEKFLSEWRRVFGG